MNLQKLSTRIRIALDVKLHHVEFLKLARKLIADPANWVQKSYATDKDKSRKVPVDHPDAHCFCAVGAADRTDPVDQMAAYLLFLVLPYAFESVEGFNDSSHTTHQDVLDLYDRAIQIGEEIVSVSSNS